LAHYPVLLPQVLEYLDIDPSGLYVDCTLGESRYAEAIVRRLETGRLIAIDRDRDAIESARVRLREWSGRVTFHHASYGDIETVVGADKPQGIVADLGLSRGQFESAERGFSFQRTGPLDMRMDQSQPLTADVIVNQYDERDANAFDRVHLTETSAAQIGLRRTHAFTSASALAPFAIQFLIKVI